jgi:hypothetical protein
MCGKEGEFLYEMQATAGSYQSAFTTFCRFCSNVYYCDCVNSCKDCFGCTGLNHKQYCIFNKQYTKEEYERIVPKIIQHMIVTKEWGEYFPSWMSPFGYNETIANEYFEIPKDVAMTNGFKWKDGEEKKSITQTCKVPSGIEDVSDEILNEVLTCNSCGHNYKLILQELNFYRQLDLPIPRICPDCRRAARMKERNPHRLWERECLACNDKIFSSYSPNRPEKVYCEKCYLKDVN